jgi:ribosomal-protein-alanine N-acetyltransferase
VTDLKTDRLILRGWRDADLPAFAAMNDDPVVMEYMPKRLSYEESRQRGEQLRDKLVPPGLRHWIIEAPGVASLVGIIGLGHPPFEAAFTPCVEIGWRLARPYWGAGYATEAARGVMRHGFGTCALEEIVAFTTRSNSRSRTLMERLGMRRDEASDFDHPNLPADSPIRPHVLYRITKAQFEEASRAAAARQSRVG